MALPLEKAIAKLENFIPLYKYFKEIFPPPSIHLPPAS
jgi:hypothetical protein